MDDDGTLAMAAAGGDATAFTRLVERHEKSVRNLLDRLCRGAGAGDDLAQDTFIRAWRHAASYRGEASYKGWLFRIAWRVFLSSRSAKHEDMFDPELHGQSFTPQPMLSIDLERAFGSLGARERAVAVLCFGEGFSHQEAAPLLDLPLGTLKSIATRARKQLISHLEASDE